MFYKISFIIYLLAVIDAVFYIVLQSLSVLQEFSRSKAKDVAWKAGFKLDSDDTESEDTNDDEEDEEENQHQDDMFSMKYWNET